MSDTQFQRAIRILVVDDEPTITEFLELGLGHEGFSVATAADGVAALKIAQEFAPDVVILDLMLPELDGMAVCRHLRSASEVGILMLTARGDLDARVEGLETGADDYLVKPFKFRELLARVRAILRRRHIPLPHMLQLGDLKLDRVTHEATLGHTPLHLTPREWDLLELLLLHPRQVLSRDTILTRVWGYSYVGETNVVEVNIRALRDKLGDHDKTRIQTIRGIGYILRG